MLRLLCFLDPLRAWENGGEEKEMEEGGGEGRGPEGCDGESGSSDGGCL